MIDPPASTALHRFTHDAMACIFGLGIVAEDERRARQVARAAFDELDRIEQLLSRFIAHSDVARINTLRPGESVRVELETVECLQLAEQLHAETDGAFDVAYRSRAAAQAPLVFDPRQHAVGVRSAGVDLDLGGLGKGYALDRVVALLREWQIPGAVVHAGQSTVYAFGRTAAGGAWRVALRDSDAPAGTIELSERALSGSGQRLHGCHIIDPGTGVPVADCRAAWSVAPTAAVADALSTAFMVMSTERVATYCRRHPDVSAILRTTASEGHELVCFGPHAALSRTGAG